MKRLVDQLLQGQCSDAAKALSSKRAKAEAVEDFSGLSTKVLKRISTAMAEKVAAALEQLSEADIPDQDENLPDKQVVTEADAYIKACTIVLKSFVEIYDENMPEEVEQLILDLCGEAMLGFPTRESMQDAVARLGLDYLCSGASNRLGVSVQLVPSLLWKVLHPDAKAADAKRLNQAASAGAFQILDFEMEQSTDTLEMILRASMHPIMLQTAEGKRCIATFLDLGPVLAGNLLGTMRAQIQMGKAMVLDAYGEILYKAWQNCSEENRDYIEQDIIQEVMNSAILARTTQLHTNLVRMLSCIHEQKDAKEMLQRLYQPILWPALAAPNANVRRNAVSILLSAFPITDGKSGDKEALEATVTMQVTKIANALRDTDPSIRKLAAAGACELLLKYWELFTQFSGQLIGKLMALLKFSAFDAESPKTRVAVLEGLASLVQNPLAQSAVAITFQDLKPLLYDSSRSVRKAMVEFIQQVAGIKTLKWWESFPPADLVSIMGSDNKDVAEIIHNMLFTQYVEGDDLNLQTSTSSVQACAGLVQLLRDSSSAGAAFCRTLAERAISGDNENISAHMVGTFAVDLADYLASCAIKTTPAKSKAQATAATVEADKDNEEPATQTGSKRGKRPRAEDDDVYGEWETQEGWTAISCGLKELVVPIYKHCRQQIDAAAEVAEASTSKKKGRRGGGGAKKKVTSEAAVEAENLLQTTFPAEMLVVLLKNAPSTHGVQEVLSIGVATHKSDAAISLAEYCLDQIRTGCIQLPNLRRKTGGKLQSITLASITRQEHLPVEQCRLASAVCVMMDLLVKCEGSELLRILRKGLLSSPDLPQVAGTAKRTRKAGGKKAAKGKVLGESELDVRSHNLLVHTLFNSYISTCVFRTVWEVNGALAMIPMLFRDGADIHSISTDGLSELLEVLGGAAAEFTTKLSSNQPVTKSALADAILTTNCFYNLSAVAASQDVAINSDVEQACKAHVDRMQEHVLQNLDDEEEPMDLEDTCSQLFTFLTDLNGPGNRAKRSRALESEWRTTNQQGAMLIILGHCTVDLAVGANTAMDKYEELLIRSEEEDGSVTETQLDEAEGKAVAACMNAWSAGQSLMERHAAFVLDLLPDPTMRQLLWMSTEECIPAVRSSLEAVLRGLSASRLPGDFPHLMSLVGVHLAIAQAVSSMTMSKATLKHRLDDLVYVVLNGCSILAPDSSDIHGQRRPCVGTTPIPSPLQGLNIAQQQEYIPQLLQATYGVLGLLRIQSGSNDKDSLVDVTLAAGWLFSGIAALTTTVAYDVRNALRQHMKDYLKKHSVDEQTPLTGCKMLLAALGDG